MNQVVWPPPCGQFTDVALVQKRLPGPGIGDSKPGSLDCESGILPLSHRATEAPVPGNRWRGRQKIRWKDSYDRATDSVGQKVEYTRDRLKW